MAVPMDGADRPRGQPAVRTATMKPGVRILSCRLIELEAGRLLRDIDGAHVGDDAHDFHPWRGCLAGAPISAAEGMAAGKRVRAIVSLTIATFGDAAVSVSLKARPATSRVR